MSCSQRLGKHGAVQCFRRSEHKLTHVAKKVRASSESFKQESCRDRRRSSAISLKLYGIGLCTNWWARKQGMSGVVESLQHEQNPFSRLPSWYLSRSSEPSRHKARAASSTFAALMGIDQQITTVLHLQHFEPLTKRTEREQWVCRCMIVHVCAILTGTPCPSRCLKADGIPDLRCQMVL